MGRGWVSVASEEEERRGVPGRSPAPGSPLPYPTPHLPSSWRVSEPSDVAGVVGGANDVVCVRRRGGRRRHRWRASSLSRAGSSGGARVSGCRVKDSAACDVFDASGHSARHAGGTRE
jgi:hypothetical protein